MSEALKKLKHLYDQGKMSKEVYDQKRVQIINRMTGTVSKRGTTKQSQRRTTQQRQPSRSTQQQQRRTTNKQGVQSKSSSRNPSRRNPSRGVSQQKRSTRNTNKPKYQDDFILEQQKQPQQPPKPKVGLYAKVAPRTSEGFLNSGNFGTRPEQRDPNTIERTTYTPTYEFGHKKTGVADVDDLLEFLQKLDEELKDVETSSERHRRIQDELPAGVFVSKQPKTLKNEEGLPEKVKAWKILKYAKTNKVRKVEWMINLGVSVDYQDHDSGNTALIMACVSGQKEAIFYLVEKGANINMQNYYGNTPLHELVKNKRENLAIWLIKHGADIYLENKRTYSAFDLALPWFQKDMKKIASGVDITAKYTVNENFQTSYSLQQEENEEQEKKTIVQTSKPVKIYFKNNSYKSVFVTSAVTVQELLETIGEKMNINRKDAGGLQLVENQKGRERKLLNGEKVLEAKRAWPLIVDQNSKIDPCHFRVEPKYSAPKVVSEAYAKFINT